MRVRKMNTTSELLNTNPKPMIPKDKKSKKISFPIRRKVGMGFGLIIAVFIILQTITIFNIKTIHEKFTYVVRHDARVLSNAEYLMKLIVDMETGQRGFIITGEEHFLDPYTEAIEKFNALLEEEKILVSDNPSQVQALDRIDNLVSEWREKAAIPEIELGRKIALGQVDAQYIQDLLSEGLGKSILDKLRAEFEKVREVLKKTDDYKGLYFVSSIEKAMVDQETGQRGFLITGKEVFLEPYVFGKQDVQKFIKLLRVFVSEDPKMRMLDFDIDKIEALTKQWDKEVGQVEIAARREMNKHPEILEDVADLLRAETGKNILDALRYEFNNFITTKHDLTEKRYVGATVRANEIIFLAYSFIVISTILSLIIAVMIVRGILSPIRTLIKGSEIIAEGNFEEKLDLTTNDEFDILSNAFDDMRLKLKALHEELARSNHEVLEEKMQELARSNEELDNFAYIAAHDLKEPLRAIHNHSSFLLEDYAEILDKDGVKKLHRLVYLTIRMEKLISDLLYYSRIGREKLAIKETDLNRVVADIKETMQDMLQEKNTMINIPETLPTITGDRVLVAELLRNLITNAIKYNDNKEKKIEVGTKDSSIGRVIYVKDNGIGIEKSFHQDIFRIFKRLHSEKEYGEGTGSGLTFVRKIVEQHGGKIWLESKLGEGTTFFFTLKGAAK